MKSKIDARIILFVILIISAVGFTTAYADQIITSRVAYSLLVPPVVSVYGKTYSLNYENETFAIYYGFNSTRGTAQNISILQERDSMQIALTGVTDYDSMWIQFPNQLISADMNKFVLYVNGQERGYELATTDGSTIMGFMIPAYSHTIEIKGTRAIPEFSSLAGMIMAISIIGVIVIS